MTVSWGCNYFDSDSLMGADKYFDIDSVLGTDIQFDIDYFQSHGG